MTTMPIEDKARIQQRLCECPGVAEALVEYRDTDAGQVIVAWVVVADSAAAVDIADEVYAIQWNNPADCPAVLLPIDRIPRDGAGEVVLDGLPEPSGIPTGTIDAPTGEVEEAIAAAATECTGVYRIGRRDNLFALGLDSVRAISMASALRNKGFPLSPKQILLNPTVAALAVSFVEGESADQVLTETDDSSASGLDPEQLEALLAEED
ncbi:hypothetical protein KRX51_01870 [Corynebacterium sp. TAE3-ERU12]|uniref:phosphopantetheine-binding protein n=1 Tax=Corynebacterium sp. TAE3-ERU12 TaxID=2849491 RepID=UPI001C48092E|nr:phosphopantetheine-binding protein [Corynebacterium sp. TAE3-ERU12]MBV7294665.1 hypothetical protein [Corynebacterium sp. TAE3-ERU12]